jgi:hypothetical protein
VDRIEITECGICRLSNRTARDAPGTASGTMQSSDGKLLASTATIPARDGLSSATPTGSSAARATPPLRCATSTSCRPRVRNAQTGSVMFQEGGDRPQEHGHLHRSDYMLDK